MIKIRFKPLTADQKYGLALLACYPLALAVIIIVVAISKWVGW